MGMSTEDDRAKGIEKKAEKKRVKNYRVSSDLMFLGWLDRLYYLSLSRGKRPSISILYRNPIVGVQQSASILRLVAT